MSQRGGQILSLSVSYAFGDTSLCCRCGFCDLSNKMRIFFALIMKEFVLMTLVQKIGKINYFFLYFCIGQTIKQCNFSSGSLVQTVAHVEI